MTQFIDTRAAAVKEGRNTIRSGKRSGAVPAIAAKARRQLAEFSKSVALRHRAEGRIVEAKFCLCIARGHLIIARMWDKEAAK